MPQDWTGLKSRDQVNAYGRSGQGDGKAATNDNENAISSTVIGQPQYEGSFQPSVTGMAPCQDVIREGWLLKQSRYLQDWRRRWIVLTKDCLISYKGPGQYLTPTEYLSLQRCSTVKSADEDVHKANAFRVDTADRVFFLVAANTAEKEAWIGTIGRQMVHTSARSIYCEEDIIY